MKFVLALVALLLIGVALVPQASALAHPCYLRSIVYNGDGTVTYTMFCQAAGYRVTCSTNPAAPPPSNQSYCVLQCLVLTGDSACAARHDLGVRA